MLRIIIVFLEDGFHRTIWAGSKVFPRFNESHNMPSDVPGDAVVTLAPRAHIDHHRLRQGGGEGGEGESPVATCSVLQPRGRARGKLVDTGLRLSVSRDIAIDLTFSA